MSREKHSSIKIIITLLSHIWLPDRDIRKPIFVSTILTFFMIALNLSIPFIFKHIINTLSQSSLHSNFFISFLLIGYGLSWMCSQLITQARTLIIFHILGRSMRTLSLKTFDHLLLLSMRFHFDRQTGSLISSLEKGMSGLESIFYGMILYIIPTSIEIISIIILTSYLYGLLYGCALFIVMGGYLICSMIAMQKEMYTQELYNQKRAQATARIVDGLLNIETVKYFNNERYEHEQADYLLKLQEDSGATQFITSAKIQVSQALFIGLGLASLTWMAGKAVYNGTIEIGDFVLINGYILQFIMPLNNFSYILHQVKKGAQDLSIVIDILHLNPEIQDSLDAIDLIPNESSITFDNVYFGYQPDRMILKGVSFTVAAGTTLAIVGQTGSGKSTISRLLFRFYDINAGTITINGHDIRQATQQSLHQSIGIVPQDIVLFNDSLYYNIAYGNPDASKKEVENAATSAHLDSFINSLPDGYNTMVGERGLKLSGGEKQRVAIARALLKKPSVFIFDEATSSLDSNTEREIQKKLEEVSAGTTTIIIAHRLSTITKSDTIIVLDQGTIVEQGTHAQLLNMDGLYAQLWYKQHHAQ